MKGIMPTTTLFQTCCTAFTMLILYACVTIEKPAYETQPPAFDPKNCLNQVPKSVDGLDIIQGPRTEQNIAADMHVAYCNGQVLLKQMNAAGKEINSGTVRFRVTVEYTGEVMSVEVVDSEIDSDEFLKKVSDMIMDSDFTPWHRHDEDTEFIYPMTFNRWWEEDTA
jgi:hypothetical protein